MLKMDIAVFYGATTLMLLNVYSICKHIPDVPLRLCFAVYGSTLSLCLGVVGAQVAPLTVIVIGFTQLVRHTI